MILTDNISAEEALEKLKIGNAAYLDSDVSTGDISRALRLATSRHGQSPYAIIVALSLIHI